MKKNKKATIILTCLLVTAFFLVFALLLRLHVLQKEYNLVSAEYEAIQIEYDLLSAEQGAMLAEYVGVPEEYEGIPEGYEAMGELALKYYHAIDQGDFETALSLLYRSEDTIFKDSFIIDGFTEQPLLYYKIQNIEQLAEDVYEVSATAEIADGNGRVETSHYVISLDSKSYLVLHWTDMPTELYNFEAVRGF